MRSPLALSALLLTGCEALTGSFHTLEGTGGAGGQGGGAAEGGGIDGPCGGVGMLVDDFEDGIVAQPWADDVSGTALITEEEGLGVARAPNGNHAFRKSYRLHDLRDSEVRLEVVEPPTTADAFAFLEVKAGMDSIMIAGPGYSGQPDNLVVTVNNAVSSNVTFQSNAHRWWRIRQTAGQIFAETSPSGEAWDVIKELSAAEAFDVSLVEVSFGIQNNNAMEAAVARFDRVNGGGAFEPNWCKAGTLTDDFSGGGPKPEWVRRVQNLGCLITQKEGGVVIEFDPAQTATNGCLYNTGPGYDLRDSSVSVQLAENSIVTPNEPDAPLYLQLRYNDSNYVLFTRPSQMVEAWVIVDNVNQLLAVAGADQGWWRFRESNGTLFWETSTNGREWSTLYRTGHPFPLDAIDPTFGMGGAVTTGAMGRAKFDNFNLP
ncbi:MAG TPA: hypothetical protein VFB62_14290 [Polyangiaceae bacterium]|nr:hypothetical protein [Polyangiaceae bacterium]